MAAKAKFNRRANFNAGDRVKIASLAAHPSEGGINWMNYEGREGKSVYYGKKVTVTAIYALGKWISVNGLYYRHPAAKFKLIKRAKEN